MCRRSAGRTALVLAGLAAEGITRISGIGYVERGYQDIGKDIRALGGKNISNDIGEDTMFLNVEESMEHRRKEDSQKIRRIIILSISGIILLGVLLFGVLFYTINVEVVGNNRYSEAQIKEMVMKGAIL